MAQAREKDEKMSSLTCFSHKISLCLFFKEKLIYGQNIISRSISSLVLLCLLCPLLCRSSLTLAFFFSSSVSTLFGLFCTSFSSFFNLPLVSLLFLAFSSFLASYFIFFCQASFSSIAMEVKSIVDF